VLTFTVSLIPFITTFYPKSKESKPRSLDAIISSTVPIEELIQVGPGNLFNYPLFPQTMCQIQILNITIQVLPLLFLFCSFLLLSNP
jgi:hypothetical protein